MVALVRHGRTAWNEVGRLQGRVDLPLSASGREQVCAWRLPADFAGARFVSSPLTRARETAALLGAADAAVEPDLIEMDWGGWQGQTLASLRETQGAEFAAAEARGLDLRPPGGESPRDVQRRVAGWFERVASGAAPIVAVTHKGVLRAVLAQVTGWPMLGKAPVRLADDAIHLIEVGATGAVRAIAWNVSLLGAHGCYARRAP